MKSIDSHIVRPSEDGWRLDKLLAALPSVGSRSRARSAIQTGKVRLRDEWVAPDGASTPVHSGDEVAIHWNLAGSRTNRAKADSALADSGLRILFEDEWVIAVDKPAGLLTDTATRQQARDRNSVRKEVHAWQRGRAAGVWVVHRIDRDTTGVVLLARDEQVANALRDQFRQRRPLRQYRALVWGSPTDGIWEDWMSWDRRHRRQRRRSESATGASLARCNVRRVDSMGPFATEIEVRLDSGRRNQIRLQAQLRGCPLVGERQYIDPDRRPPRKLRTERQMLHAQRLSVHHPATGKELTIEAPDPDDYCRARAALRRLS